MSLDGPPNNKMMDAAPATKFFTFPGDGIWHPERIEAATVAEAEAIYHQIKRLVVEAVGPVVTPTIEANTLSQEPLSTPEAAPKTEDVQ